MDVPDMALPVAILFLGGLFIDLLYMIMSRGVS
jgi:hypothetical protein